VRIYGEPLRARSVILYFEINLQLLKISKDIDRSLDFESIWPFILYLFNNWARHQVKMMGVFHDRPDLRKRVKPEDPGLYEVLDFDREVEAEEEGYNEELDFSSEIEYDDRFDLADYQQT